MSLPFSSNIPNAPDDPADDQPLMQTNFGSINTWTSRDHFEFADNKAGIHRQVTLQNEPAPGLGSGTGTLYANTVTGQSWPFWQNALGSFQLLGPFSSLVTTQATTNGFTFLPGGIIIQWGQLIAAAAQTLTPVTFAGLGAIAFPNNGFNVQTTNLATSAA